MTTETQKMTSGEALAEILARLDRIESRLDSFSELAEEVVSQVQEVAASGLGNMLGGLMGVSPNGDSEHSKDPS